LRWPEASRASETDLSAAGAAVSAELAFAERQVNLNP